VEGEEEVMVRQAAVLLTQPKAEVAAAVVQVLLAVQQ
jgi:hypothetical protein